MTALQEKTVGVVGGPVEFEPPGTPCVGIVASGRRKTGLIIAVVGGNPVRIIAGVHIPSQAHLLSVAEAPDSLGFGLGFAERGEQHAREDGDNGDDDEQLN